MALIDDNHCQKMIAIYADKLKWNPDNIKFIWDYEDIHSL